MLQCGFPCVPSNAPEADISAFSLPHRTAKPQRSTPCNALGDSKLSNDLCIAPELTQDGDREPQRWGMWRRNRKSRL